MSRTRFPSLALAAALCIGCAPGSKLDQATKDMAEIAGKAAAKAEEQSVAKDLREVYTEYMNYHDAHAVGPASWDELISFAGSEEATAPLKRAKDKGVQVKWGVKLSSLTEGSSNTVFAQGGGGPTMMFDGSVQ